MFEFQSKRRGVGSIASIWVLSTITALVCLGVTPQSHGATWRVEAEGTVAPAAAETAKPSDKASKADAASRKAKAAALAKSQGGWTAKALKDASGSMVLHSRAGHNLGWSPGVAVSFPAAGTYHVAVRFLQRTRAPGSFAVLLRDEAGQGVFFRKCDWLPMLPTQRPYEPEHRAQPVVEGLTWQVFTVVIERPMQAKLSFGTLRASGRDGGYSTRNVDCVVFSNDADFSIDHIKLADLPDRPQANAYIPLKAPKHMKAAPAMPANSAWFRGVDHDKDPLMFGMINNASLYLDYALATRRGFNADHGSTRGSQAYGIKVLGSGGGLRVDRELAKKYKSPIGRFVNSEGKVSKQWSLHFAPARQSMIDNLAKSVRQYRDDPKISSWSVAVEQGGWFDYSPLAIKAFRKWLGKKYKNITALNKAWDTDFPSMDKVEAPKSLEGNKAGWFAFRQFCSESYTKLIADRVAIVQKNDPQNRPTSTQASNLDLLAPYFKSVRPMDWEDMVTIGLKNSTTIGWDGYAADDYMGAEVDLLSSLGPDKRLVLEEWNIHNADARIAGRTFWTLLSKGLKGIYTFQAQEGTYHNSYPKWSLSRHDNTPKNKLGAYTDAIHQAHQFESLLSQAQKRYAHKPVAMYYSVNNLALQQPSAAAWSGPLDSPYHVYELLRAGGFDVRWITPRQIEAGQLSQVSAVVLLDAAYIPGQVADKLAAWVKAGGVVVADMWPGVYDMNAKPQHQLLEVFGIAPVPKKTDVKKSNKGKLAIEESTQGYGEVTINALDQGNLRQTVAEVWQQFDSTHPMGKAMGDFMFSGFGRQNIVVKAGHVVGMTFGGKPSVNVNAYGKGQAMYSSLALGSLYSGSAARYEWDSSHSGAAPYKLMATFLDFAGVKPTAKATLPWEVRRKLRVEAPLVSKTGNVMIGLVSFNDLPLGAFDLTVAWPAATPKPKQIFFTANGSRELVPMKFVFKDQTLQLKVPGFDTHGAILAVQDMGAMVSLRLEHTSAKASQKGQANGRGPANLLVVRPNQALTAVATLYNTSKATLSASDLKLGLPQGWFMDRDSQPTGKIKPGASQEVRFQIHSPALCTARALAPIQVRYQGKTGPNGHIGLATALVWWQTEKNDPTW